MKNKKNLLYFLIFIFFQTYAQVENDSIVYSIKGDYIEKFPNRITAKLFYTDTYNSYVFGDRNSDLKFDFEPNKQNRIGASVSYDVITLSYSFAPNFLAENKDNEESKLWNLNIRMFPGKWMQTLNIYSEKGFYESNLSNIYFPDTKSLKIGGSTSYIFNDNFSFRAISNQDEKQLKSAGTFIAGATYYYSKFNLVAESDGQRFDEDLQLIDFAISPSYYYNIVPVDNLLLSLGATAGIGINYSKSDEESLISLLTEWSVASTLSYDVENLYFGANFSYLVLNHNTDRSTYTEDDIPYFQAFIGYRLRAPKKWVRTTERLKNKINF